MTKELFQNVSNIETSQDGRYIIFDISMYDTTITVVAIYAPNKDNESENFFRIINSKIRERSEHKIIVGDFNLTLNVDLDRLNTYCNNNKALEQLENIIEVYCLKDVWRNQNNEKREYSWIKNGDTLKASRIDFALVSGGLDQKIKNCTYLAGIKTDHRAFYMAVDINPFERGMGYWKFNVSHLRDKEFTELMNEEIDICIASSIQKTPLEVWEILKTRIAKVSKNYSRSKAACKNIVIANLSEIVCDYESRLPLTREENGLYESTKRDLDQELLTKAEGLLFRSKVQWYEEGEKNTKYFFSLEKARYNAKTCYRIINQEGQDIQDPTAILEEQRKFYQDLYQEDKHVKFTCQNEYGVKVPEEIVTQQELQLTMIDLERAVKAMNNNKTPGGDGIPVDFYKVFWGKLKQPFYQMALYSYEVGKLHESARKGILNLIPKSNKDSRFIKNLRPITLLNVDYKIIEKAIANKMIPALEHIIHKDQRGFMKNRRISVNIRKMLDIIHRAEIEDIEAVILSMDFVKCFDKCSFSILHGSLEFFGFGQIVKIWTKILYKDFFVQVQNNGNFSQELPIQKGVHQGGCCSSIYFLVIAEILALALRHSENIEGITLNEIRNVLNQFADDMDVFTKCTERSLKEIHQQMVNFHYQSGFEVSYDKTTLYRIGSLRHSSAQLYDITQYAWSNQDINVLGVTISHEDLVAKNYNPLIQKTRQTLNAWYNRGLSLVGKIQVVNTLVSSLFVYKMMVLPAIPENLVKSLENIIRDYLWSGKKSKISMRILQNSKDEGGLNLVNFRNKDKSLKATWPKILYNEEEYATLVYHELRVNTLKEDIWRCRLLPEDVKKLKVKNQFWLDVLMSWSEYNSYYQTRLENQLIWYNSKIKVRGKVIMWNDVYKQGLKYVYQLFEHQHFKTEQMVWNQYKLTVLRFNSLKAALPLEWKTFFMENPIAKYSPVPPHNYDHCLNMQNFSSSVYKFVSSDLLLIHNKYLKWLASIGTDFCESLVDYGKAHGRVVKVTNIPKFRSFQYRLLQRAIVTNTQLCKWKIIQDDRCYFCREERETIEHLFFHCRTVQQVWTDFFQYIRQRFSVVVQEGPVAILFNQIVAGNHVANFLCLIAKQYIYQQRCLKGNISLHALKAVIAKTEDIEKYIALKNGKVLQHEKKWNIMGMTKRNEYRNQNVVEYINEYIDEM